MANYYGSGRTNYFKVKDKEKFEYFLFSIGGLSLIEDGKGRVGFLVKTESGDLPLEVYNDETDIVEEVDVLAELATHLEDGEVAVYQTVGAERLRYLVGYAVAINSKGEKVSVSINDIYKLAQEELGGENITVCEF